jgi:hypothetical protein
MRSSWTYIGCEACGSPHKARIKTHHVVREVRVKSARYVTWKEDDGDCEYKRHEKFRKVLLVRSDQTRHSIKNDIFSSLYKQYNNQTLFKMRFSLTTIAIALLGSAMALPSPDVSPVEERAAVSALIKPRCLFFFFFG